MVGNGAWGLCWVLSDTNLILNSLVCYCIPFRARLEACSSVERTQRGVFIKDNLRVIVPGRGWGHSGYTLCISAIASEVRFLHWAPSLENPFLSQAVQVGELLHTEFSFCEHLSLPQQELQKCHVTPVWRAVCGRYRNSRALQQVQQGSTSVERNVWVFLVFPPRITGFICWHKSEWAGTSEMHWLTLCQTRWYNVILW